MRLSWHTKKKLRRKAKLKAERLRRHDDWEDYYGELLRRAIKRKRG